MMVKTLNLMVISCECKTYREFLALSLEVNYKIYQEQTDFMPAKSTSGDISGKDRKGRVRV